MILEKIYNLFWGLTDKGIYEIKERQNYKLPNTIKEIVNIRYAEIDEECVFDMYYPKSLSRKKLPTILHIHGGAYVAGSKELNTEYCRILCQQGYCVLNMNYVLSPKEGFPRPVYDVFRLFKFIERTSNINKHIDFNNFVISGDSAGGHIAGLVANIQTNKGLKERFQLSGGPKIKGCILTCSMMSVYKFNGLWPKKRFEGLVFKENSGKRVVEDCNILNNLTPDYPPTILISVNVDFIKLHANMFDDKADILGNYYEHYTIVSGDHIMHDMTMLFPYDHECLVAMSRIVTFLRNLFADNLRNNGRNLKINWQSLLDKDFNYIHPEKVEEKTEKSLISDSTKNEKNLLKNSKNNEKN